MAEIKRKAEATWKGDLKTGNGVTSGASRAFQNLEYSFGTRFEDKKGTNPEEMIASAHASCFSMQLAGVLSHEGIVAKSIHTVATVTLKKDDVGFNVTGIHLDTTANIIGVENQIFQKAVNVAHEICPMSRLLKPGLESFTIDATLQQ